MWIPTDAAAARRCDNPAVLKARLIVVVALSGALAVAACGGGGSSGPTKAQFDSKANAICKTAAAQTTPLEKAVAAGVPALATGATSSLVTLTADLAKIHTDASAALAKLRTLKRPSGASKQIEKFLTPLSSIIDSIGKGATALGQRNTAAALSALEGAQSLPQEIATAAGGYGLPQCGAIFSSL
jgi:hypothetical protein